MAVFIDTNIFAAAKLKRDVDHKRANTLLKSALYGNHGQIFTSDYVFDETITLLLMRTKKNQLVREYGNSILTSSIIEIIKVNDIIFENAWEMFGSIQDKLLSFTDFTTIAITEELKIDKIMSFDKHFDGMDPNITRIY